MLYSGAVEEIPYLSNTFFPCLDDLTRYYLQSSKRLNSLLEQQKVDGFTLLRPSLAAFTRWPSYDRVLDNISRRLVSYFTDLKNKKTSCSTALGLYRKMCTKEFVAFLLIMCDVFPLLAQVSRAFQKEDVDLSDLADVISSVGKTILGQVNNPGTNYKKFEAVCKILRCWLTLFLVCLPSN